MKECNNCSIFKIEKDFYKGNICKECRNQKMKIWRTNNPEKFKEYHKKSYIKNHKNWKGSTAWRKDNPEKAQSNRLKYKYNISLEDYNNLCISQNHKCKVCDKKHKLFIDHCHKTNKIRGLLCNSCNKGLGLFYDSVSALEKAAQYIKDNNEKS